MKITVIGKYNTSFMHYFKLKHGVEGDELIRKGGELINDGVFGFKAEMEALGHEVQLVILNFQSRQASFDAIIQFSPDIIYIGSYFEYYDDFLKELKERTRARVISWIASPLIPDLNLSQVDFIFSSLPNYIDKFRSMGIVAERAIVGVSGNHIRKEKKDIEVGFIGGIDGVFTKTKYHLKRTELIKYLSRHREIHKWGYGFLSDTLLKTKIKTLFNGEKLYQNYHGEIWGADMFRVLSGFKINVNSHAEIAGEYAVNNRMFETTGVKTLLLTDEQAHLQEYFVPDKEVVTYKSKEECIEKINYLLAHEDKLNEIAQAGFDRTMKFYTIRHYAERFEAAAKKIL